MSGEFVRKGSSQELGPDVRALRPRRRPYRAPTLSALGDVRDVTLGGSPGMGDTQNPMTEGNIPFYGDYIIVP